MIKLNKTEYSDIQEIIDEVQKEAFEKRDPFLEYAFELPDDFDYMDYVGRKIRTSDKIFTGRNIEHAILECICDAIDNGKDFYVEALKHRNGHNIKRISFGEHGEVEFSLVFNAEDQSEGFDTEKS